MSFLTHEIFFLDQIEKAKNNVEVGRYRLFSTLAWVYCWGYTTPEMVAKLLSASKRKEYRWIASWVDQGLLKKVPSNSPIAREIIILSREGASLLLFAFAKNDIDKTVNDYVFEPSRINFQHLTHTLACQMATLKMINEDNFNTYICEREFTFKSKKLVKQPDVIIQKNDLKIALEIELSPKNQRNMDTAILANLDLLDSGKIDAIWYVTHVKMIENLILKTIAQGSINIWGKNKKNKWCVVDKRKMSDENKMRIQVKVVDYLDRLFVRGGMK